MPFAKFPSTALLLVTLACADLHACDRCRPEVPTMVGTVWQSLLTDTNGKTRVDRLVFADHTFTSTWLQSADISKVPFTETVGASIDDPIPWQGEMSDSRGNKIAFTGTVEKNEMRGTLTMTPTTGDARVYLIVAAKTGTAEARKLTVASK